MSSGKFGPGYSFRSGDFREKRTRKPASGPPPETGSDEGMRPCARGSWCASSYTVTESGETRHEPALGPRTFCDRDRGHIERCLGELPEQYVRLYAELGNPNAQGIAVRIPFGPRIPIRVDIDVLTCLIAEYLVSWHERVAHVAQLHFPVGRLSRLRREGLAVQRAQLVLSAHLDALLALPAEPMSRAWDFRDLERLPEGATGVIRSVFADVTVDMSGADAGLEILHVRYLARAILGETRQKPEELVGVPCRDPEGGCGWRAVYRAELPSHEDEPVWWTECARCGDRMTETEYREWVALCAAYERHRKREPATLENLPGVA
jgi:hypothetical protein